MELTNKKLEYFALLSPFLFYIGYFIYGIQFIKNNLIENFLFGIFIPFFVIFFGVETVSFWILIAIIVMTIIAFLAIKSQYKFWIWSMLGWAYVYLCFWCGDFIAGV